MIRQIIHIDEEKCNGCGLCANACKEAAIGIVGGKAKLLREDFCDGLGNCLPAEVPSMLSQWPVQIKLAGVQAPYFRGCDLLIAADCTAYAYGDFHRRYINGRVTLIGCPKLDDADYAEKLGGIIRANDIRSITVARMEVPCCGGIENAVNRAVAASGKDIPVKVDIITTDGQVID